MKRTLDLANTLLSTNWNVDGQIYNLYTIGWTFGFNNRKKSLGLCHAKSKIIYLSESFVLANPDNMELWNDTLRHEIAHAIDLEIRAYTDHSEIWKNIGRQVGCNVGCHNDNELIKPLSKYTLKCENCGAEAQAHRTRVNKAACSSCCVQYNKGKFSSKYVLTVIKNF